MKLLGKYLHKNISESGIEVTFAFDYRYLSFFEALKNKVYSIEIKNVSNKRSLQSNSYLWALISQICKVQDGNIANVNNLYIQLLEMAGVRVEYAMILEEAYDFFKEQLKYCKIVNRQVIRNKSYVQVASFAGSSSFTQQEMNDLIDTTLRYAAEVGIDINYWEGVLK